MNDGTIGKTSVSPGEMLRLQRETEKRSHVMGQLTAAFLRGEVFGDNVDRLRTMIGGSVEELSHAELELSFARMLAIQNGMVAGVIRGMRG